MKRLLLLTLSFSTLLFLTSCDTNNAIVSKIDEKEANEIVVYLASKGIESQKVQQHVSDTAGASAAIQYDIMVSSDRSVDAMAILNRVGLPRRMGTNLLELFAKSGLMSSATEETIRYQAGLSEELRNTVRKIDGVIDADVQISFPAADQTTTPGTAIPKIMAAVYVKHQGILDDPNSHMEIKIKRLMANSVSGLDYDNVAVISDRSRFTDIILSPEGEPIGTAMQPQTYASIWGVILTKSSLTRFRVIFFAMTFLILLLCGALGWFVYKFYPQIRKSLIKKEEPPVKQAEPEE